MASEVFMPKAGMDMQEGTLVRWLFSVGDRVRKGEALVEIETDKVTMEVESPADGVLLRQFFEEGSVVPVATIIGYVGEEGEAVPDKPSKAGGEALAQEEAMLAGDRGRYESAYTYQVAVIGGGPAGYTAAIRAARLGAKTVLFEKNKLGGTCTNVGCIPMKTYVSAARILDTMGKARSFGITYDEGTLKTDLSLLHAHKEKVIKGLAAGIESLLADAGVELVREEAALIGEHTIEAAGKAYRTESVILCGGSTSGFLPVEGTDQKEIVTSEGILDLTELPDRLLIVGGGVIGCETAAAFSRFGSNVTIVEMQDRLIPTFDREVSQHIETSFKKHGITVMCGRKVERFIRRDDRPVLILDGGDEIGADCVLISVGRKPALDCLGVLSDRIDLERGKIMVDDECRTNIPHIFACGDLTNRSILAHSAMKMGETAAYCACHQDKTIRLNRAPLCLYTIPEAASIGLTEEQARLKGDILVGKYAFRYNGRAASAGETEGFVKVLADKAYGEILGVHIVGAQATELIVEAKTMMDMEITVYEVADIMHPHPTYSEVFMEACAEAIGSCLNLPQKKRQTGRGSRG